MARVIIVLILLTGAIAGGLMYYQQVYAYYEEVEFSPDAVLINCSRPEAIPAALEVLSGMNRPYGAYANGFTHISDGFLQDAPTVDALQERHDLGPGAYADQVMRWIDQGATIVGGCCEIGPDHIEELAHRVRAAGHNIV